MFSLIAAIAKNGAIGKDGGLPWGRVDADMRWFLRLTTAMSTEDMAKHYTKHSGELFHPWWSHGTDELRRTTGTVLIVGHRTAVTLPSPLTGRTVIVLRDTTAHGAGDWACKARTFTEALEKATAFTPPNIFVCGGTRVYQEALRHPGLERLYLTEVDAEYPDADTWFPEGAYFNWEKGVFSTIIDRERNQRWRRTHVSSWLPTTPSIRFGMWERV